MNQQIEQFERTWELSPSQARIAREKLDKLNRRAEKLGIPGVEYEIGEQEAHQYRDHVEGVMKVYYTRTLTARGGIVGLEGWNFVARIWHVSNAGRIGDEHYEGDQNIIEARPGAKVDKKWRTAAPNCDHCGTRRYRKDTYLLAHAETGEVKQVGSTCLRDFLGVDPRYMIQSVKWCSDLMNTMAFLDEPEEQRRRTHGEAGALIDSFLRVVCGEYYAHGFTTSRESREAEAESRYLPPTGAMVFGWFVSPPPKRAEEREYRDQAYAEAQSERARRLAAATLYYLGTLEDREDLNDYEHNLSVYTSIGWVAGRGANTVASAIKGIVRQHEEWLRQLRAANSEWIGEEKQRMELWVTVLEEKNLGSDDRFYPPRDRWLYTFVDDDGNILKWFTDSSTLYECWPKDGDSGGYDEYEYEVSDRAKIKATVKAHKEWRGSKETIVNRVAFVTHKPEKKKKSRKKKADAA